MRFSFALAFLIILGLILVGNFITPSIQETGSEVQKDTSAKAITNKYSSDRDSIDTLWFGDYKIKMTFESPFYKISEDSINDSIITEYDLLSIEMLEILDKEEGEFELSMSFENAVNVYNPKNDSFPNVNGKFLPFSMRHSFGTLKDSVGKFFRIPKPQLEWENDLAIKDSLKLANELKTLGNCENKEIKEIFRRWKTMPGEWPNKYVIEIKRKSGSQKGEKKYLVCYDRFGR